MLRFGRRTDDGWANEDVAVRSGPALGQFVTLDLDADARPHLAYHDIVDPTASSTGTVYYALGPEVIDQPTAIDDDGVTTPDRFELGDNFPNPFNPETVIPFTLASTTEVEVAVYNLAGQKVRVITQGMRTAGHHQVRWHGRDRAGRDAASGTYLVRMRAAGVDQVRKMLLLR